MDDSTKLKFIKIEEKIDEKYDSRLQTFIKRRKEVHFKNFKSD